MLVADEGVLAAIDSFQLQLLRMRKIVGWDFFGKNRAFRDRLLRNRFRGFSQEARENGYCHDKPT